MDLLAVIVLYFSTLAYPGSFREGDWVNFTNFRFITSAAMDQTNIYFGTTNGVIRYDRFGNRWLDPMTITDGLPNERIDNIAYDPDYDRLYVSTPLGAAYYQPTFQQWYPAAGDFPTQLVRNDFRASALSALTTEYGYTYLNGRLTDLAFNSYQLTRGVDDGFYHLFVGTYGLGPVVINSRYGDLKRLAYGPYTEDATVIFRIDDHFWMGGGLSDGVDPGITTFDTTLQEWRWFVPRLTDGLASARLTCGIGDRKGIWLGTEYGLVHYDPESERFITMADFSPLPSVMVTSLAADSAWVYVGTDYGLGYVGRDEFKHRRKKESDSLTADSLDTGLPLSGKNRFRGWRINNLKVIDNYLYVATNRGALRRPMGYYGDFEYVNTPESMLSDDILDITKSGDSLFFATRNDVIVINTKTAQATTITDPAQFGTWHIRKILIEGGNLWAATDAGLWKYRFSDAYSRLFTVGDGMISDDVRSIEILGDYIWLATPKGAIRFFWNRPGRFD